MAQKQKNTELCVGEVTTDTCYHGNSKVIAGNFGHTQISDSYTYFVLVLNKEQHCNYNSSTVTSYTHILENEHDTMSIQYIISHKYAIHTNK